ncbi:MAG TPA: guanine deaminase [Turneriella sp.]|nr:guanine deaminase [Turneriella sp.]HNJ65384.1 guanine deaminase [Turneriella sp.]HNL11980.1 guanine deaminase [Turneriella sp.]HNL55342.1 guanine deaminase [Turneriella sp.]
MTSSVASGGGIIATFINPNAQGGLNYYPRACLLWNAAGVITYFGAEIPGPEKLAHHEILLREQDIVLPGLIDLHTHLPQYEFAAQGAAELLPWLERYTYPQESRFADARVAEQQSSNFFMSCLQHGTTTVVAYLSSFAPAAEIAFAAASAAGIRAYLGLTLMDRNTPEAITTTTARAEREMLALVEKYHRKGRNEFVVTPRFAISCSEAMLQLCGEMSRAHNTLLQTHISENKSEIEETLRLFPGAASYTDVYDRFGCLHERTLLGHGIHLSEAELNLISAQKSVIVHCPVSNNFLGSGIMPYQLYIQRGIRTGLGTDVAAGYSLSMLNEARQMTEMAKLLSHFRAQDMRVGAERAVYQATLGNALCLGRNDLGCFEPGRRADLVVIDDSRCDTMQPPLANQYTLPAERLMRVLYRSTPNMVKETLIDGKEVFVRER